MPDFGKEGPQLRTKGPIRVTLPAAVAFDPDRLKKSLGNILDRIGCAACCSGADILLQTERDLVLDADDRVQALAKPSVHDRTPDADVRVALAPGVEHDIDKVFQAVDRVIDIIGPHPCISGFDVLLQDEIRVLHVDEQLNVRQLVER